MNLIGYDSTWGDTQIDKSTILSTERKKTQNELDKRQMKDSYAEAIIPLGILISNLYL